MSAIAAFIWRTALRRGLLGGSRPWMTVFAVVGVTKLLRRLAGAQPETVFSHKLEPGEGLVITHLAD